MKVYITGVAGFIGFHLARRLLEQGWDVSGIDNLNEYYDVNLKKSRLEILKNYASFRFEKVDICDKGNLFKSYETSEASLIVNLAAQAGVRYSLENPQAYIDSNITGFLNILELCRERKPSHLVYASSSSVYGGNVHNPFSTVDSVDHPVSLYAATKKSNELMAHTYSHLFGLPTTGLRFFTVYGPYGRPDMALFLFTKAILEGQPIKVFNYGKMQRDFTYVDDIVAGIMGALLKPPVAESAINREGLLPDRSWAPYRIFNIGNNNPVELEKCINILEEKLGVKAVKDYQPLQPGDVPATYADIDALTEWCGFKPATDLTTGISAFVDWYREYHKC